jgi:hypothetical protein
LAITPALPADLATNCADLHRGLGKGKHWLMFLAVPIKKGAITPKKGGRQYINQKII